MQKVSAGKFHGDAPTNLNTLRKCRRGFRIKVKENSAAEFHAVDLGERGSLAPEIRSPFLSPPRYLVICTGPVTVVTQKARMDYGGGKRRVVTG